MKTGFAILLFLVLGAVSCNKQEQYRPGDFYNCHHQGLWNEFSIFDQLLGKWQMTYASSSSAGELPVENLLLIFTDDGIMRVFRDGVQIMTTTFYIQSYGVDDFAIYSDQFNNYTEGRVLFCGTEMECSNSDIGEDDYYYRKAP